jgi:hypothetical protein
VYRVTATFGLAIMLWALLGAEFGFFWNRTTAKRSLEQRLASGEALERWVLTADEFAALQVNAGEFWRDGRLYDVIRAERLSGGLVALQVFDDSLETALSKLGRKMFKRRIDDSQPPPAALVQWASWHAVLPADRSMKIAWWACTPSWEVPQNEGKEAKWSATLPQPPNGLAAA